MERITKPEGSYCDDCATGKEKNNYCSCDEEIAMYERLKAYENTELEPEICAEYKTFEDEAVSKSVPFKRIVELMNAEAQGRLVTLPCEVGTEVWSALPFTDNVPRKGYITAFLVGENGAYSFYVSFDPEPVSTEFLMQNIGKTVFFTLAEAMYVQSLTEVVGCIF